MTKAHFAILVFMILTAGCSGSSGTATTNDLHPVEIVLNPNSPTVRAWIGNTISQCMKDQGFDYTPPSLSSLEGSSIVIEPDDLDWRRQYGFGISLNFEEDSELPLTEDDVPSDSPEKEAFEAEFTTCKNEAYEAFERRVDIFADSLSDSDLADMRGLAINYLEATADDDEWVSCMSKQGYVFSSRETLLNSISEKFEMLNGHEQGLSDLQSYEIEVAVQDYECSGIASAITEQKETIDRLIEDVPHENIL